MLQLLTSFGPIFAQGGRPAPPPAPLPLPCCGCCVGIPFLVIGIFALVGLVLAVPTVLGMWKAFEKAGEPGWASLIPIYNLMTIAKMTGRPETHGLLALIPIVGIVFAILILMDFARSFGKDSSFGILFVIPIASTVCWLILGMGDARYEGPVYEGEFGYERPRRRREHRPYRDEDDYPEEHRRRRDDDEERRGRRRRDEDD